jgi:hypothetical protein
VFDDATLDGLVASIKADGLLQNLVVVPAKGKARYRIVTGERRYRALKLIAERGEIAGDFEIPTLGALQAVSCSATHRQLSARPLSPIEV